VDPSRATTTWHSGVTYIVTCDVTVHAGVTLTVEAGAAVRFNSGTGLNVYGTVLGHGTGPSPIPFVANSQSPVPGDWDGIGVYAGGKVALQHASVSHSGGLAALYNIAGSLELTSTQVISSAAYGIYSAGPTLVVTGCSVVDSGSHGLHVFEAKGGAPTSPHIHNNQLVGQRWATRSGSAFSTSRASGPSQATMAPAIA